jgi:DnaJ domain
MNHYERLNVTSDASVEVIRAAYRALATKLHPDRQGGNAGPNEEAHEAMAALNASYLVLTHAKARADYDAQLKAEAASQGKTSHRTGKDKAQPSGAFKSPPVSDEAFAQTAYESGPGHDGWAHRSGEGEGSPTGFSWMKAQAGLMGGLGERVDASPLPRWAWALLLSSLLTAGLMVWVMMQKDEMQGFDRRLSEASQNGQAVHSPFAATAVDQPKQPVISEAELAKLSNDELLARMPALIGESVLPGHEDASAGAEVRGESDLGAGSSLRLKQSMELGSLTAANAQP